MTTKPTPPDQNPVQLLRNTRIINKQVRAKLDPTTHQPIPVHTVQIASGDWYTVSDHKIYATLLADHTYDLRVDISTHTIRDVFVSRVQPPPPLQPLSTSTFNDTERRALTIFISNHHQCYLNAPHPNTFTITFTGTGIGRRADVTCNECGDTCDITDYDVW